MVPCDRAQGFLSHHPDGCDQRVRQ
jgi:hypothetical protein